MNLTKLQAKENLAKLIQKFKGELDSGRAKDYNEEETKHSFIDPLLQDVLGWDVANRDEVGYEHPTSRGRVDYSLKIEGKIRAFIEAKPIRVDLRKHIPQAVGYGYSRKDVPFVILTDFEGIKLFDVTIKPSARNLRRGLKLDLDWKEYEKEFDKLWLLSRESVARGDLDKLLLVKPKDRFPVDKAILEDLKVWRETLAKDIYRNNPNLFPAKDLEKASHYLKEITQKILDRIIFIRFCEDKRLTHISTLKESFDERTDALGTKAYEVILKDKFKQYEILFNSDLFAVQDWEDDLKIDFSVLSNIILATCDPYQFDVIPLEVLGNIYEQYLGYTIRLTGQQVKYELKPDVRKAGGVYYTPEYIVDYIVKNTVGKLLEELPPAKIRKLRILDPACGSGSFLIRAYEEMLEYYRKTKKAKPRQEGQAEFELEQQEAEAKLSIKEKRDILNQHIFGVDIDEQAVEVTKLSLMLKMLEGEYGFVAGSHLLPMLDHNIRCGNSLISGDTLELKKYFGDDWYKVKPFHWEKQFPEIMTKEGGFDVVIGNPPWGGLLSEKERKFLWDHYVNKRGEAETHLFFIERSFKLLCKGGMLGYITPNTWLSVVNSQEIREYLIENVNFYEISELTDNIFKDAPAIVPILLFINKADSRERTCIVKRPIIDRIENDNF
ncbi:MAG: N-6 DNA methylase, partial [Candidatus Omnitrophica bacterium]|nr:N-6 DNA methylase [Candidatus Omnitrophota bacterium]